ncbi:RNA-binding protein Musashi-like Rbp6 [Hondaea fermentalgiana]|uniref:RNA-binding protein Musashi-like Rbp6 n=1 Tax=Hondaea fermentalgiana TaxID=2315210 RepID=A0A2R5GAK5_9STRA|nr:RNA-binding protein Musashi-like Rbp6 [Hondaea fermentalgiana]|eukprot:GBG26778.1 RNA-binding protein Musashi-like Rbp6 [Hondaea fermentalgiana]
MSVSVSGSKKAHARSKSRGESTDSSPSSTTPSAGQPNKLFIGGLSYDTTDESLERYFQNYGNVEAAVVLRDPNTLRSRGFGFVTFSSLKAASEVVSYTHHMIDGRKVEAKFAVPRSASNATNNSTSNSNTNTTTTNNNNNNNNNNNATSPTATSQQTRKASFSSTTSSNGPADRASSSPGTKAPTRATPRSSPQFGPSSIPAPYSAALTGANKRTQQQQQQKAKTTCASPATSEAHLEGEPRDEDCDAVPDLSQLSLSPRDAHDSKPRKSSIGSMASLDSIGAPVTAGSRKSRSTSINSAKGNASSSRVESKEAGRALASPRTSSKTSKAKNANASSSSPHATTAAAAAAAAANAAASGSTAASGGSIISNKIFVGGLLYATGHESLRDFFESYGSVESAEVIYNRDTKKSRGFGFVVFRDHESVDKVLNEQDTVGMHLKQASSQGGALALDSDEDDRPRHTLTHQLSSPLAALNAESVARIPEVETRIRSASAVFPPGPRDQQVQQQQQQQMENLLQHQRAARAASMQLHHRHGFELNHSNSIDSVHSLASFNLDGDDAFFGTDRAFSTLSSTSLADSSAGSTRSLNGPSSPRSFQGSSAQSPFQHSFTPTGHDAHAHSRRSYSVGGPSHHQQQDSQLPHISLDTLHLSASSSSPSFRASSPGPVPDSSGIWSNTAVPVLASPAQHQEGVPRPEHNFRRSASLEVSVPSSPYACHPSPALARHTSTGGLSTASSSRSFMPELEPLSTSFSASGDAFMGLDIDVSAGNSNNASLASTPHQHMGGQGSSTSPLLSPDASAHLDMGPLVSPPSTSRGDAHSSPSETFS